MKLINALIRHIAWFISYNCIQLSRLLIRLDPNVYVIGPLVDMLLRISIFVTKKWNLDHWETGPEPDTVICKYEI